MIGPVETCGGCGSPQLERVLSLGVSPPTCAMVPVGGNRVREVSHDLGLLRCGDCALVQLSVVVDPDDVFPPDYPYSSGNSGQLHRNFEDLARQAYWTVGDLGPRDLVVDIGANDGTLLRKFGKVRTVGVEPTGQAARITGASYQERFTEDLARRIIGAYGQARVVTACNVLAHVEDIHDVMRGVKALLAPDGILIAENHDLLSVDGGQWDTVYHEHLRFYEPATFSDELDRHGLRCRAWVSIPTHGGSFRMFAVHRDGTLSAGHRPRRRVYDFGRLQRDAEQAREAIRAAVTPGTFGIGATARATTIINYCELDDLECVVEVSGSDKIGHYIPGTDVCVVDEAWLFVQQPARAVLFSWHMADVIVPKLRARGYAGEIVVPLPKVRLA
jgi:SAM-dependent methyltransferase